MKEIVIIPCAGLCNRMRAIASGVYISKRYNTPPRSIKIYWNKVMGLNARFDDLFLPIDEQIANVVENTDWKYRIYGRRNVLMRFLQSLFFGQFVFNFNRNTDGNIFETIKTSSKLCLCSCHSMAGHYPIRILFRPQPDIQSRINRIISHFGINTIGVHVRRTDHTKAIEQSPLTAFYDMMQQEIEVNSTTNFFLATDDEDVKREMICRYGNKIITCNDNSSRNSVEGMKFAVVDLYCLSKTKKIIGSAASSYSELAAELGGIELYLAQSHNDTECTP